MSKQYSDSKQDTLIVQRGESLRAQLDFSNEDGTPLNLTGYTITCPEASEDSLRDGVEMGFSDEAKGIADISVPAEIMNTLPAGRSSWLRIQWALPESSDNFVSMKLWIDIQ